MATTLRPALWTRGDWNAFFGFGTNILVNMLVATGLLRFACSRRTQLALAPTGATLSAAPAE